MGSDMNYINRHIDNRQPTMRFERALWHGLSNRDRCRTAGFTLIEMLIATAIFMFVMLIAVGSLVAAVNADRKAQSVALISDNLRFTMDDISRTIRTGMDIDGSAGCISGLNNKDCTGGTTQIGVTDQGGIRVLYRFSTAAQCNGVAGGKFMSGCLMRSDNGGPFMPITAPDLEIVVGGLGTSLFYVRGANVGAADLLQPTVTLTLQAHITRGLTTPTDLHLETSLTQRVYDN
jgi:type II secretory pathway pseudopilin PulG